MLCGRVPQTSAVRRDLIGQYNAVGGAPKLELKVYQGDATLQKPVAQVLVDGMGLILDVEKLLGSGITKGQGMILIDQGIV